MPVVEKIEGKPIQNEGRTVNIIKDHWAYEGSESIYQCTIFRANEENNERYPLVTGGSDKSKIDAVWLAVVEFINWYNSTK